MGLYQLSDFLSIDDVADYLTEKQIHHFDLYESNDRYRLNEFIWGLIISDKITPVFHYNGFAYDLSDEQNREFLTNKAEYKETLIFSNSMLNDWNDGRVIAIDGFSQKPQGWQNAPRYPTPFEEQFQEHFDLRGKTSDFYKYKSFKSDKEYILDISNYNSYPNLLIPRIQLDNIFFSDIYQKPKEMLQTSGNFGTASITIVQPSIETLNQRIKDKDSEITALNAQIRELEKIIEQSKTATTPIFDSQDGYTYPPELDMAIEIWKEIYQTDNIPKHFTNHSEKFTQACKNLGFAFTGSAIETRLKKVTTPQSQKEKTKNKNSLK